MSQEEEELEGKIFFSSTCQTLLVHEQLFSYLYYLLFSPKSTEDEATESTAEPLL